MLCAGHSNDITPVTTEFLANDSCFSLSPAGVFSELGTVFIVSAKESRLRTSLRMDVQYSPGAFKRFADIGFKLV
jgi:hypothetical protein